MKCIAVTVSCLVVLLTATESARAQFAASVRAGANIGEFDPSPDMQEDETFGNAIALSANAGRFTLDGNAQASAFTGTTSTLRARASASTYTTDFIDGGPLAAGASADISDTLFFDRNGQPLGGVSARFTWHVSGSLSEGPGGGRASANYFVGGGTGLGENGIDLLYIERNYDGSSSIGDGGSVIIDIPDLGGAGFDLHYSLNVGAGGGVEVGLSSADASNSAYLLVEILDEFGNPDPTVNITSSGGLTYVIPEPSSLLLLVVGAMGLIAIGRKRIRR